MVRVPPASEQLRDASSSSSQLGVPNYEGPLGGEICIGCGEVTPDDNGEEGNEEEDGGDDDGREDDDGWEDDDDEPEENDDGGEGSNDNGHE